MAIIRNKAAQLGMLLPDDVVEYIADTIKSNIRQIEGVVKRLTAYNSILNDEINITSAKRAIKDVIRVGEFVPTPDIIIEETARYFSLGPEDLRGQRRSKNTAMNRNKTPLHNDVIYIRGERDNSIAEIALQYNDSYNELILSFANNIHTPEGGMPATGSTTAATSSQ